MRDTRTIVEELGYHVRKGERMPEVVIPVMGRRIEQAFPLPARTDQAAEALEYALESLDTSELADALFTSVTGVMPENIGGVPEKHRRRLEAERELADSNAQDVKNALEEILGALSQE